MYSEHEDVVQVTLDPSTTHRSDVAQIAMLSFAGVKERACDAQTLHRSDQLHAYDAALSYATDDNLVVGMDCSADAVHSPQKSVLCIYLLLISYG